MEHLREQGEGGTKNVSDVRLQHRNTFIGCAVQAFPGRQDSQERAIEATTYVAVEHCSAQCSLSLGRIQVYVRACAVQEDSLDVVRRHVEGLEQDTAGRWQQSSRLIS